MPRTPETLTAAQRARLLKLPDPSADSLSTMNSKKEQATLAQALANFGIGTQRANASANLKPDADMSFAVLPIGEIETYRHNPRTGQNPRYEEIKASIRADGITNMLTVTRRDKSSKYTTYGGGNTRLQIAKELFAEGDQRFATLQVVVKAWPGDAQVITAHLAENEIRGDITFWEKAQGVHQFQVELQKEIGELVSASELHAELKRRGLNYGIRTIQNFIFCVEHLRPIGKWLVAREVNEIIRPAYSELESLAQKLGKAVQTRQAFLQALQQHGELLDEAAKKRQDDPEEPIVALDAQALVGELRLALAQTLEVSEAQLTAMLVALAANARISAQELQALQPAKEQAQASSTGVLPEPVIVTPDPATAAAAAVAVAPKPPQPSAPPKWPEQPRLQGLLLSVPAEPAPQAEAETPPVTQSLLDSIRSLLEQLNGVVPLHDVLLQLPGMPFGYMTDLPQDVATVDGAPVEKPRLRAAVWKLLTALSGQLDTRLRDRLPIASQGVSWSREVAQDAAAFMQACQACGVPTDESAMPLMSLAEVAMVFADPDLGGLMVQLLDKLEQLRTHEPGLAPDGFE